MWTMFETFFVGERGQFILSLRKSFILREVWDNQTLPLGCTHLTPGHPPQLKQSSLSSSAGSLPAILPPASAHCSSPFPGFGAGDKQPHFQAANQGSGWQVLLGGGGKWMVGILEALEGATGIVYGWQGLQGRGGACGQFQISKYSKIFYLISPCRKQHICWFFCCIND